VAVSGCCRSLPTLVWKGDTVALRFGVISVDDHVVEVPNLWVQGMSQAKWGDLIPHVAVQADGKQRWVIEGQVKTASSLAPTGA
jgi:hypothetical protein